MTLPFKSLAKNMNATSVNPIPYSRARVKRKLVWGDVMSPMAHMMLAMKVMSLHFKSVVLFVET